MIYSNKIKACLAKLKVAQLEKKKVLFINKLYVPVELLEVLCTAGIILGYTNFKNFYQIFFKYNAKGVGMLEYLSLVNWKTFKISSVDSYSHYIVLSNTEKIKVISGKEGTHKFKGVVLVKY